MARIAAETYQFFTALVPGCRNCKELEIAMVLSPVGPLAMSGPPDNVARLRAAAEQLEAGFLAEMLKSAGLGAMPSGFGGGAGEDHFASFLREAQAREMAQAGGIGLAEAIFDAMVGRTNE